MSKNQRGNSRNGKPEAQKPNTSSESNKNISHEKYKRSKWNKNKSKPTKDTDKRQTTEPSNNPQGDTRGTNDAKWYEIADQIARDAGALSFNNPLGMKLDNVTDETTDNVIPGVCCLFYAPTVGEADEATSPINLQAKKLMAYLRSTVSNKLNFAAADAMMYLIAMDSMYSFYSWCVRLYGLHFAYIGMNRYYPQRLFDAMHVAADSKSDWTGFRTWLNTWAYQLSQVFVPASITYFARHMWMNANVYLDEPDSKAQTYIFSPEYLYKWNGTVSTAGTCLQPVPMPTAAGETAPATLEALMSFGNTLLTELLQDVDVAELSGVILRAFGENNCIKLSTIPEEFAIAPVYNAEVLTQIHNATIAGPLDISSQFEAPYNAWIRQTEYDTLSVKYQITVPGGPFGYSLAHLPKNRLLDHNSQAPSVDEVFVASRLQVIGVENDTMMTSIVLDSFGTEVVLRAEILSISLSRTLQSSAFLSTWPYALQDLAATTSFSSFPFLYNTYLMSETAIPKTAYIFGQINNYTVLTKSELDKLHSADRKSVV